MEVSVAIKVFVGDDSVPVDNARVALEKLAGGRRTALARGVTDRSGTARLRFDWPDAGQSAARIGRPMTVVVTILGDDDSGEPITLRRRLSKVARSDLRVHLTLEEAMRAGLLTQSLRDDGEAWEAICRNLHADARTPGGEQRLCLMMGVLGSVARLDNPNSEIEREAAKLLGARFGEGAATTARRGATRLLEELAKCNLPVDPACVESIDMEGLAQDLMDQEDGPFAGLMSLAQYYAPDPEDELGEVKAGHLFTEPFVPDGGCEQAFDAAHPDGLEVLAPPTVNLIEAWDPTLAFWAREGRVASRELDVRVIDTLIGQAQRTVEMDVPLEPVPLSQALVMVRDTDVANDPDSASVHLPTGNQILAVDVKPGMKIKLSGANFVADQAILQGELRAFTGHSFGRLTFSEQISTGGWPDDFKVTVHGDDSPPGDDLGVGTATRDEVVFEWPEDAFRPGLYSMRLVFENTTGIPTSVEHGPECDTVVTHGPVMSQVIHFVVLPHLDETFVQVRATEARANEKMHLWYDNVRLVAHGQILRVVEGTDGLPTFELLEETEGEHIEFVGSVPKTWEPNLRTFPAQGVRPLDLSEFHFVTLGASHVPHTLASVLLAILLAAILLVLVLIVLTVFANVIMLVISALPVLLPAKAAGAIVAAIITGTFGVTGTLLTLMGTLTASFHAMLTASFAIRDMGSAEHMIAGAGFAHQTSVYRFHRAIWPYDGLEVASAGGFQHLDTQIEAGSLTERWRTQAHGGDYRFTVEATRFT